MANLFAIHSVGSSLVTYLRNTYPDALRAEHSCEFRLFSGGELAGDLDSLGTTLSLYLYRVRLNEHRRNSHRMNDPSDAAAPLWLDLHYLMTIWADSALVEQTVMAWAMRQFHFHPVLDVSSLSPEAAWEPADAVQLVEAELSDEDMMRIWDGIGPSYRLTVSYVARVVRIDRDPEPSAAPVVATRFEFA